MKTYTLINYFKKLKYTWENDAVQVGIICALTKTRTGQGWLLRIQDFVQRVTSGTFWNGKIDFPENMEAFAFTAGMEQPFLIKAIVDHVGGKRFLEIGTGRGTAAYAVSLLNTVEEVVTIDVIPFEQRQPAAINGSPVWVSNEELYDLMPLKSKQKISFYTPQMYEQEASSHMGLFDVAFIDGNHDDVDIIKGDFEICMLALKDHGYIIWDDYDPSKFKVKEVVDDITEKYGFKVELVPFRGHLFGDGDKEDGAGEAIMRIDKSVYEES